MKLTRNKILSRKQILLSTDVILKEELFDVFKDWFKILTELRDNETTGYNFILIRTSIEKITSDKERDPA